ncbi:MAG: energy-coupling factor ABC transporter ATP-binding protein [Actinobacteria bacterium]|jgi:biotin transport system ATP-binding protein|nr:energy-coupling factor ABC transporter ATP-binding protein [Actinomycetota bacterium]
MIELRGAGVTVPSGEHDAVILHPTTLTLGERRISIIGGNGSGKSTLARLCNGLIEPTTGSVIVSADTDITTGAATALDTTRHGAAARRLVGFVFSDPSAQLIMPTVLEDVALSLRREHRKKPDRLEAARAVLERFGIAQLAERSVHTLSGGQRQLLAFAAVLASDPAILVADEPTTLLDLRNARMINDLLLSLPQQVLVITHDLELAARADRTLVVDDAQVIFDGPPAEAIAFYRELSARGSNNIGGEDRQAQPGTTPQGEIGPST